MQTYNRVVRFLKTACQAEHPISIRRVRLPDNLDGDCRFRNGQFLIRINRNLTEHEAVDTVLHEVAHVHAWDLCHSEYHCDEWGKAYSRIYRLFLKEFLDISR